MNTTQTSKGELLAGIQVTLVKADYEAEVKKALNDYQRKATLPGFRQGKVPFGMIKKMYGQAVLLEKINQKVSEALNNHIIENKLDLIGYPLPDMEQSQPNDLDNQEELNFYFEAALKPEIKVRESCVWSIPMARLGSMPLRRWSLYFHTKRNSS